MSLYPLPTILTSVFSLFLKSPGSKILSPISSFPSWRLITYVRNHLRQSGSYQTNYVVLLLIIITTLTTVIRSRNEQELILHPNPKYQLFLLGIKKPLKRHSSQISSLRTRITNSRRTKLRRKRNRRHDVIGHTPRGPYDQEDRICGLHKFDIKMANKISGTVAVENTENGGTNLANELILLLKIRDRLIFTVKFSKKLFSMIIDNEEVMYPLWKEMILGSESPMNKNFGTKRRRLCKDLLPPNTYDLSSHIGTEGGSLRNRLKVIYMAQRILRGIKEDQIAHSDKSYLAEFSQLLVQNTLIVCNARAYMKAFDEASYPSKSFEMAQAIIPTTTSNMFFSGIKQSAKDNTIVVNDNHYRRSTWKRDLVSFLYNCYDNVSGNDLEDNKLIPNLALSPQGLILNDNSILETTDVLERKMEANSVDGERNDILVKSPMNPSAALQNRKYDSVGNGDDVKNILFSYPLRFKSQRMIRDLLIIESYVVKLIRILDYVDGIVQGMTASTNLILSSSTAT